MTLVQCWHEFSNNFNYHVFQIKNNESSIIFPWILMLSMINSTWITHFCGIMPGNKYLPFKILLEMRWDIKFCIHRMWFKIWSTEVDFKDFAQCLSSLLWIIEEQSVLLFWYPQPSEILCLFKNVLWSRISITWDTPISIINWNCSFRYCVCCF